MSQPPSPDSRSSLAPLVSAAVVAALLVLGGIGYTEGRQAFVADRGLVFLTAVGYGSLGPWVWTRAVQAVGRRMTWVGLAAAANWAVQAWSATLVAAWGSQWTWLVPVLLVPLVLSRFPDGRPQARWRLVERSLAVLAAAVSATLAVAALGAPRTLLVGPSGSKPGWSQSLIDVALVGCALWGLAALAQLLTVALQARSRSGAVRGQLVALGVALLATLGGVIGLTVSDAAPFEVLVALALPLGLAAAVLRYALYDLDLLVHRLGVWVVLTAAVVAAVVGVSWLVVQLVPEPWTRTGHVLVLAGLVLVLDPVRRHVQRGVDRLLFGHRSAPVEALSTLGQELSSATARHSTQELCRSVAMTLALPWVGLRRGDLTVASWGRPTSAPLEVALAALPVPATLLLCPRRSGEHFSRADLRVVRAMAGQVAVAVRALALADDLQGARARLVRSREEERKRLRNDLHDGVGPALAGVRLQVRALARRNAGSWSRVEADLAACSTEVARVVDGLRPPVLDAGLPGALQREAARWDGSKVLVEVHAEALADHVPLPAAVETAAYRIAAEAVANAVRHAAANKVAVELAIQTDETGDLLVVSVGDDGTGTVVPREGGVGLTSMRDRAEELGGSLAIRPAPGRGTVIRALLPIG